MFDWLAIGLAKASLYKENKKTTIRIKINHTTDISAPFYAKMLLALGKKFLIANLHSESKMYNITITASYS